MTSKPVALLLADLGVTRCHSRPHVSNDNPYSESQFKTLKYRPECPDRFGSVEHGRSFCGDFFPWYNTEHHHVGLGLFTPHDVHYGPAAEKREQRALVLADAFACHPERFPNGPPQPQAAPTAVWIKPPAKLANASPSENTLTQESRPVALVDPGASCAAVPAADYPQSPNLMPEDLCMAVAQQTHEVSVSKSLTGSELLGQPLMPERGPRRVGCTPSQHKSDPHASSC
jgi:hypothetical protein